jgi:hypothetical protein
VQGGDELVVRPSGRAWTLLRGLKPPTRSASRSVAGGELQTSLRVMDRLSRHQESCEKCGLGFVFAAEEQRGRGRKALLLFSSLRPLLLRGGRDSIPALVRLGEAGYVVRGSLRGSAAARPVESRWPTAEQSSDSLHAPISECRGYLTFLLPEYGIGA